ncbi:Mediator of RNA polymerase II transcription subunit 9 [Rhynchospora pubera]|uniref:Mediator of RNA polymerase II transcription subunit 9 n=1 Tax=Rhynchospora pubera TaxID=906938 RepID=A0AAV8AKI1_9POAL|nr:Mediator of RNA polymerase II transcription subunit 9 [Rhynchospora pubera]KAJ4749108.1 Mediator of RNA polymerase II transcription subunit 9 [Rhynchospora pubera]
MEQQQQYGGGKWNSGGGQGQAQEHFQSQSQSQSQAPHASLASHFHLLPLVEKLANGIEAGSRDQHFDTLLEELTNQFTRCQQLLNSISGTISSKSMTVEGQKRLLEETMQQLNQRRDLMNKYRLGVEEVTKSSNI